MSSKLVALFLLILLYLDLKCYCSTPQSRVKAGYYYMDVGNLISDINSKLFSHLICAFTYVNSSTYHLSINSSTEQQFSTFAHTVKIKNPSVTTLLSIWVGREHLPNFFSMINQSSYRNSFVQSSIETARLYGFQGLDLCGLVPTGSSSDMANFGTLLDEWRVAVNSEAKNSSKPELLLVMAGNRLPALGSVIYPIDSMRRNLDWVHVTAYDYYLPGRDRVTYFHAALYGPSNMANTDDGINEWKRRGFLPSKLVLGLPFHGYAWTLLSPQKNPVGATSTGPVETGDGSMNYYYFKWYIRKYAHEAVSGYNATSVVNYWTAGFIWINYDDVEAVRAKVSYVKQKGLLGYNIFQVRNDDNWVLSTAAAGELDDENQNQKGRLSIIVLVSSSATIVLLLGLVWVMCYLRKRKVKSTGKVNGIATSGNLNTNVPDLVVYSYADIEMATNKFSFENKLGEGGYGPVYKGVLSNKQEIAVKKLSKASTQGFEEFKNEVTLTAKLQHVNLVRVLGFCIERDEQMLIYEYMPNKSLDFYLFDSARRFLLDWKKCVHIIEGITQGLLYLQEYSRLTIIHRDLKASNILLDNEMKPKISDFGMAKIFSNDEHEANTGRIVGTYGYVSPEYVKKGLYSTKSDVYSFGVLILQIISGKKNACFYGLNENLILLEYAYDLWKLGKGMEFMDPSLDDTVSSCKLLRCLQIGLLCVQENATDRPSILEVFSMLKSESAALPIPKIPAFSTKRNRDDGTKSQFHLQNCSINGTTLSQMVAR
ncbi:putative cysteine-rich receptor-like protein kinase 35 isoform X4 [Juglans microcarpa x Juglans regia]|uniref:putative cysteine-rich receptor-like protein kinase 35 isoform X4 n=1 Tax=Juglans microcarpa x Juglans regia TaxID=2249226 RepID=UPI001B7E9CC9|nr:putative cysteine-rich receptor-like protein kinase 35 isoform X4 [Juglans microcarpa x Juglans regia]